MDLSNSTPIYSTLDIEQLFSIVVEEAIKLTSADRGCLVVVRQNQDYTSKIACDASGNQIPPENFQFSHTVVEAVMANKAALFKIDVWGDDDLRSKQIHSRWRKDYASPVSSRR